MQPNNQNPYYPPRQPVQPPVNPGANTPAFSGLPKGGTPWGWIIAVILLSLMLIGATVFAFWAFGERQDYKNHSDKKAAAAVEIAKKEQSLADDRRFAEELKNPLKTYVGPESYGSVSIQYPKTWSAYISTASSGTAVLDAYFNPDVVPNPTPSSAGSQPAIALRVQVVNQTYNQVVNSNNSYVISGKLTATPYALPKMPDQIGMKFTGALSEKLNGTQIVLPLRDKTLIISTDTDQFLADFNNYILPNLTFVP